MTAPKEPKETPVESTPARFTLKTGTVVQVDGIDVRLVSDTEIEAREDDREALAKHDDTTFAEYPKRVTKDGVEKNVNGPDEEAEFFAPPRKTGLEDVSVEHERDADLKAAAKRDADRKKK